MPHALRIVDGCNCPDCLNSDCPALHGVPAEPTPEFIRALKVEEEEAQQACQRHACFLSNAQTKRDRLREILNGLGFGNPGWK